MPALLRIRKWQVQVRPDAPDPFANELIVGAIASYFSPEAKAGRRRRKSNAPIVNKSGRPTVKLSARAKKD